MQQAKRVTEGEDFHREIIEYSPTTFNLIETVPEVCKIECKGKEVPCKVFFKYKSEGFLTVYASFKHKEPSIDGFEYSREGRPACLYIGS